MATVYRLIVENQMGKGSGRINGSTERTTAKKGRDLAIFGGSRGGVEHNRKMRAFNQLFNRATGGAWEKGVRIGRAGAGLITRNTETGKLGVNKISVAILVAAAIAEVLKLQKRQRQRAESRNEQNFKALENGFGSVNGEYEISRNFWDGRITLNENK